jgi:hypothetical protein
MTHLKIEATCALYKTTYWHSLPIKDM